MITFIIGVTIIIVIIFILTLVNNHKKSSVEKMSFSVINRYNKSAVVLVPGLGGSVLDVEPRLWCNFIPTKQIWPSAFSAIPGFKNCWADHFKNTISEDGRHFHSKSGIKITPRTSNNGLDGVSNLSPVKILNFGTTKYYEYIIKKLRKMGHKHLYGAPYDFRLIMDVEYLPKFIHHLKALVQQAANKARAPVVIIGHSLGCPVVNYFLNTMPQKWKDTYIRSFISLAGPYGGATKALDASLSGETEGLPDSRKFLRNIEKNISGNILSMNYPKIWGNTIIAEIGGQKYTANDIATILKKAGEYPTANAWTNRALEMYEKIVTEPGVQVHLLHGNNIPTVHKLVYDDHFSNLREETSEGDGTVSLLSLLAPVKMGWKNMIVKSLYGVEHSQILRDPLLINYLPTIIPT